MKEEISFEFYKRWVGAKLTEIKFQDLVEGRGAHKAERGCAVQAM